MRSPALFSVLSAKPHVQQQSGANGISSKGYAVASPLSEERTGGPSQQARAAYAVLLRNQRINPAWLRHTAV